MKMKCLIFDFPVFSILILVLHNWFYLISVFGLIQAQSSDSKFFTKYWKNTLCFCQNIRSIPAITSLIFYSVVRLPNTVTKQFLGFSTVIKLSIYHAGFT